MGFLRQGHAILGLLELVAGSLLTGQLPQLHGKLVAKHHDAAFAETTGNQFWNVPLVEWQQ